MRYVIAVLALAGCAAQTQQQIGGTAGIAPAATQQLRTPYPLWGSPARLTVLPGSSAAKAPVAVAARPRLNLRRFFGPFYRASPPLNEIQIVVTNQDGPSTAVEWYFNNYFLDPAENYANYRQYFSNDPTTNPRLAVLPSEPGGAISHTPTGSTPGIVFTLDAIRYSSRYGGSIGLHFVAEPYFFELRDRITVDGTAIDVRWDLDRLALDIHVVPRRSGLYFLVNLPALQSFNAWGTEKDAIRPELAPAAVVTYVKEEVTLSDGGPRVEHFVPVDNARYPEVAERLNIRLRRLAELISRGVARTAERFSYGWLHATLEEDVIGRDDLVTLLELADDRLEPPITTRGKPYYSIALRLTNLSTSENVVAETRWAVGDDPGFALRDEDHLGPMFKFPIRHHATPWLVTRIDRVYTTADPNPSGATATDPNWDAPCTQFGWYHYVFNMVNVTVIDFFIPNNRRATEGICLPVRAVAQAGTATVFSFRGQSANDRVRFDYEYQWRVFFK